MLLLGLLTELFIGHNRAFSPAAREAPGILF